MLFVLHSLELSLLIGKAENTEQKAKVAPVSPHEHLLAEVQAAFKSACTATDASKALTNLEQLMESMATIDGGRTTPQFRSDVQTLNERMEPAKSLDRVLPLMQLSGLDSKKHVQILDQADGRVERLVVDKDKMIAPRAPLDAGVNHQLYATTDGKHGWRQAIKPQYVEQARLGDCYFLSGLQALAAKNPEAIKNMIHDNGAQADGSHTYTVRFPGAKDKPVTVSEPTLFEVSAFAQDSGGLWTSVLEKAHRELTKRTLADYGDNINSPNGFLLFSPNSVKAVAISRTNIEPILATVNDKDRIAVTNSRAEGGLVYDANGNRVQLVGNHMYSLLAYDQKKNTVTLGNPWGENRAIAAGIPDPSNKRIHTKFDAIFNSDSAEPKNVTRNGARLTISLADYKQHYLFLSVLPIPRH